MTAISDRVDGLEKINEFDITDEEKLEELEDLYDFTPPPDSQSMPPLNDDLTKEEIEEAEFYFQVKMGVMAATGEPGAGKETFMHFLLWKLKTIFKDFRVMLDKKPRMLFGSYIPITPEIVLDEFRNLDEQYRSGKRSIEHDFTRYSQYKAKLNPLIEKWTDPKNGMFYNSGMGLGEFWGYFNNREPHAFMNKVYSPLLRRYRHHNLLIIGTTPELDELDKKRCLNRITHEVICSQAIREGVHKFTIRKYRHYIGSRVIHIASKPIELYVDALAPRERLGGKCIYDLFNSFERDEHAPRIKIRG